MRSPQTTRDHNDRRQRHSKQPKTKQEHCTFSGTINSSATRGPTGGGGGGGGGGGRGALGGIAGPPIIPEKLPDPIPIIVIGG